MDAKECSKIYINVKNNANELFAVSEILSKGTYYGKAISNLILGVEEYIKCFLIFLEGHNFELRKIKGVNKIFNSHYARHSILIEIFSFWVGIKYLFEKNNSPSKENLNINKFLLTIFQGLSYSSWWEKADQLKQNGLYVGYHNKLLLPSDFNEKDYQDSLKFTKPVILEIDEFIKHIDQMSAEELDELRKLFEESDFKSLINEAIFRID